MATTTPPTTKTTSTPSSLSSSSLPLSHKESVLCCAVLHCRHQRRRRHCRHQRRRRQCSTSPSSSLPSSSPPSTSSLDCRFSAVLCGIVVADSSSTRLYTMHHRRNHRAAQHCAAPHHCTVVGVIVGVIVGAGVCSAAQHRVSSVRPSCSAALHSAALVLLTVLLTVQHCTVTVQHSAQCNTVLTALQGAVL